MRPERGRNLSRRNFRKNFRKHLRKQFPLWIMGLALLPQLPQGSPVQTPARMPPRTKKIEKIFNYFNYLRVRVGGLGVGVKCLASGGLRKLRNLRKFR